MVAEVAAKLQTKSDSERSRHGHKLCGTGSLGKNW